MQTGLERKRRGPHYPYICSIYKFGNKNNAFCSYAFGEGGGEGWRGNRGTHASLESLATDEL